MGKIIKMRAIEYNSLTSWVAYLRTIVKTPDAIEYTTVPPENILPEYPRDLSNFKKPSIILQKVATDSGSTCFGNGFIGQAFDDDFGYIDVHSIDYMITYQLDIWADSQSQNMLMVDMARELILFNKEFSLYDYTADFNNPPIMGTMKLVYDIETIPMNRPATKTINENKDFRTSIRFYLNVIQTILPKYEYVDLSKGIKITQVVALNDDIKGTQIAII